MCFNDILKTAGLCLAVAIGLQCAAEPPARAKTYQTPIKIIVGFGPASAAESSRRLVGRRMTRPGSEEVQSSSPPPPKNAGRPNSRHDRGRRPSQRGVARWHPLFAATSANPPPPPRSILQTKQIQFRIGKMIATARASWRRAQVSLAHPSDTGFKANELIALANEQAAKRYFQVSTGRGNGPANMERVVQRKAD